MLLELWLLLNATAIRLALELDLPDCLESFLTRIMQNKAAQVTYVESEERELFRKTRYVPADWCHATVNR